MTAIELIATILKRLEANKNEPNSVKGSLFSGLVTLIAESDMPFPIQGWPLCDGAACFRGADLILPEDDEAWCDACWDKLSAEERSARAVRLTDRLFDAIRSEVQG